VLPQVLAGLGLFGLISAGCLFWLERLQPLFFALAIGSMVYEILIYWRRPHFLRTIGVKVVLAASVVINLAVMGAWVVLWFRYR
jgi:hypothetical protein